MLHRHRILAAVVLLGLLAGPAQAVLVESGDGTGNTSPPRDDPGFDNVGARGALSAIYVGNGWVLTANHVGAGPVVFEGVVYDPVPGAERRLHNADGSFADLLLFGIAPEPNLPGLAIRSSTSLPGGVVTLVGQGRDRGVATDSDDPLAWAAPPEAPDPSLEGYRVESTRTMRWGTNRVDGRWDPALTANTTAYVLDFDAPYWPGDTADEAQVVNGDSGGALFAKQSGSWELAGVIYLQGLYEGQLASSVLYGNLSFAADLSVYREEIEAVTALPEPGALLQLGAGGALLGALSHRRLAAAWGGAPLSATPRRWRAWAKRERGAWAKVG